MATLRDLLSELAAYFCEVDAYELLEESPEPSPDPKPKGPSSECEKDRSSRLGMLSSRLHRYLLYVTCPVSSLVLQIASLLFCVLV
jgi:hypothetical protein